MAVSQNTKNRTALCPNNPTPGHISEKNKSTNLSMCTPIFIAALFTIAKIWKQPKQPSTDEWIKKIWYTETMEYYSAIKKNINE